MSSGGGYLGPNFVLLTASTSIGTLRWMRPCRRILDLAGQFPRIEGGMFPFFDCQLLDRIFAAYFRCFVTWAITAWSVRLRNGLQLIFSRSSTIYKKVVALQFVKTEQTVCAYPLLLLFLGKCPSSFNQPKVDTHSATLFFRLKLLTDFCCFSIYSKNENRKTSINQFCRPIKQSFGTVLLCF